jgi:hypothetical protein
MTTQSKSITLHLGVLAVLAVLFFVLPASGSTYYSAIPDC